MISYDQLQILSRLSLTELQARLGEIEEEAAFVRFRIGKLLLEARERSLPNRKYAAVKSVRAHCEAGPKN